MNFTPYNPFTWLARIGQGLNIFTDAQTGQVLELNSTPTSVDQEGTPFSVERMNSIEQGIGNNSQAIVALFERGDTTFQKLMTGRFI